MSNPIEGDPRSPAAQDATTKHGRAIVALTRRAESAEARCAAMEPLFNKACAIVDAWDSPDMEHPLQGLRDAARAALAAKGDK